MSLEVCPVPTVGLGFEQGKFSSVPRAPVPGWAQGCPSSWEGGVWALPGGSITGQGQGGTGGCSWAHAGHLLWVHGDGHSLCVLVKVMAQPLLWVCGGVLGGPWAIPGSPQQPCMSVPSSVVPGTVPTGRGTPTPKAFRERCPRSALMGRATFRNVQGISIEVQCISTEYKKCAINCNLHWMYFWHKWTRCVLNVAMTLCLSLLWFSVPRKNVSCFVNLQTTSSVVCF